MHDHFRYHACKEELEQAQRKAEAGPVVAIFHHFEAIALEINFLVKVHFMKCLHWYTVLPIVFRAVFLVTEMQIVLHWPARVPCFLIFAGRYRRCDSPEDDQDGQGGERCKEESGPKRPPKLSCQVPRDNGKQGEEKGIAE
jgi:hypothetical protein